MTSVGILTVWNLLATGSDDSEWHGLSACSKTNLERVLYIAYLKVYCNFTNKHFCDQ